MYKVSYTGDGETTEFLFAFPFFQDADVRVAIDEAVLDDTQYGVVANEAFDGGTIVLGMPPMARALTSFDGCSYRASSITNPPPKSIQNI